MSNRTERPPHSDRLLFPPLRRPKATCQVRGSPREGLRRCPNWWVFFRVEVAKVSTNCELLRRFHSWICGLPRNLEKIYAPNHPLSKTRTFHEHVHITFCCFNSMWVSGSIWAGSCVESCYRCSRSYSRGGIHERSLDPLRPSVRLLGT